MKKILIKSIAILLVTIFVIPASVFAQRTSQYQPTGHARIDYAMQGGFFRQPPPQAQTYSSGNSTAPIFQTGGQAGSGQQLPPGAVSQSSPTGGGGAVGELVSCSVSAILATLIQNVISGVLGVATAILSPEVPVADNLDRAKDSGVGIFGIPILPSWDALAQCLGNIIIAYLSQSALQYAQSGFGGNPAFLNTDLSTFLGGIQDQVTTDFIYGLSNQVGLSNNPNLRNMPGQILGEYLNGYDQQLAGQLVNTGAQYGLAGVQNYALNNRLYQENIIRSNLAQRQHTAQDNARTQLNWGSGYFPSTQNGSVQVPGSTVRETILSQGVLLPLFNTLFSKMDANGFASLSQFLAQAVTQVISNVLTPKNQQQAGANVTDTTNSGARQAHYENGVLIDSVTRQPVR